MKAMSKYLNIYIVLLLVLAGISPAIANDVDAPEPDFITNRLAKRPKIPVDSTVVHNPLDDEMVIVGNDTISIVLTQKNYGRYDRGLYNYLFTPKGQWVFGLTASYGEFSSDDVQILSVVKDLDLGIKAFSIKPSISYMFDNNQSLGLKLNFTRFTGNLGSLSFDFSDDMNFTIGDISYYSQTYNAGIFYRNYVGLGRMKRFGVFNEVDLSFGSGASRFKRQFNGEMKDTRTNITQASLNFSPGVAVFIMDNVAFNVSFGVFGLKMSREKQITDGVEEGSRFTSGANFRFNIFNINFGIAVFI